MPTQEQAHRLGAEFERQYPESLSDRLKWWVQVLDIDRIRLFRLLGLSGREAARTPLTALSQVVEPHEDQAEILDDMLVQLLAEFDYDLQALCTAVHNPEVPPSQEQLPYKPSPQARRGILLNMIVSGGPLALRALLAYLSEPGKGGGHQASPKECPPVSA
jgi:hypothetical protein